LSGLFANADPVAGALGGFLIGLAGALMLLGAGRIAGVSGIAARATGIGSGSMALSSAWMFLAGLPIGSAIVAAARGGLQFSYASAPMLALAGLLVGFGTRIGSGCTSGHGVCGVSRLSRRSMVATATFMIVAIGTVWAMRMMGANQ
jgi:uncharacterized membrane protein YedE/YeeE